MKDEKTTTKVDKKFISFLKREAKKKRAQHQEYVRKFEKSELIKK